MVWKIICLLLVEGLGGWVAFQIFQTWQTPPPDPSFSTGQTGLVMVVLKMVFLLLAILWTAVSAFFWCSKHVCGWVDSTPLDVPKEFHQRNPQAFRQDTQEFCTVTPAALSTTAPIAAGTITATTEVPSLPETTKLPTYEEARVRASYSSQRLSIDTEQEASAPDNEDGETVTSQ